MFGGVRRGNEPALATEVRRHDQGRPCRRLFTTAGRIGALPRVRQRPLIVCDTGPLVALANQRDEHYFLATTLFRDLFMTGEEVVLPATVLAEVCYWLNQHGGPSVEAAFLDSVADGTCTLVDLTREDVARMAELVRQFSSFPLGGTDASVVAVAERLGSRETSTLDRRHFPAITQQGGGHFTLLPPELP